MVYKYSWSDSASDAEITAKFREAMMANANRGGENVAPGALIGALMGAAAGHSRLAADLLDGLAVSAQPELNRHIDTFANVSFFANATL